MKKLIAYLSLWQTLLFISVIIMIYLVTVQINEVLSYSSALAYFKQRSAQISWAPSQGSVDYYLLQITDTNFLSLENRGSALTTVKEVKCINPFYQLPSENNHSYQVSVKAVSYNGFSSGFSAPSILFICDQEGPAIKLDPLPSFRNLISPNISITGSYRELNLDSITINNLSADVNRFTKTFSRNITLAPGTNQINLVAKDMAGNTSREKIEISYAPNNTDFYNLRGTLHPYAIDYNRDGRMDLICGTEEGKILIFINKGSNNNPRFSGYRHLRSIDGDDMDIGSRAVPCISDMNQDGLMDLLMGSGEGYLYYSENQGSPTRPVFGTPVPLEDVMGRPIKVDSNSSPCVVDWDDDSKDDILLGSGDGNILLYRNEAANSDDLLFSSLSPLEIDGLTLKVESNALPFIADWDGDGGKDLLIGDDEGYLHLYLNSVVNGEPDLMEGEKVDREAHAQALEKDLAIPYFIGMGMSKLMQ